MHTQTCKVKLRWLTKHYTKLKKAKRVVIPGRSEADRALYTAVDMAKKKRNRNMITAETTFSDTESPVYYNSVALEKPTFEADSNTGFSLIAILKKHDPQS